MFRLIIVGAGAIARVAHVPAAIASPFVELVGIVDPDTDRARSLCLDYGLDIDVGSSAEELGCSFDGAIVATPNNLHAETAAAYIRARVPVLVEKPLATTVADADSLVELARAQNTICAVGYHTRHSGACRALKKAIASAHFGVTRAFAHQDGSRGGWSPVSGYNLDLSRAGGGVLVSTGTHFLDRLLWLWGQPKAAYLSDNAAGGPESHCIAHFEYDGTASFEGRAFFSKLVQLAENTVVETSEGVLIMASDADESILFRPNRDPSFAYAVREGKDTLDPRSLYQRQLEDFVHACQNETEPAVDVAAGADCVRLVAELYGRRQPLGPA